MPGSENIPLRSSLADLAQALAKGASMELYMTPKPGLVDLRDSGSHPDLTIPIMEHSIGIVSEYLTEIVRSLQSGDPFACQQQIAIRAERRLYDELGTNTHKGYIFLSGMLLIAHHHAKDSSEAVVRRALSSVSEAFFRSSKATNSNGEKARSKFNSGGIVRETIDGYPSLFEEALPVFRGTLKRNGCIAAASFAMMARLMQTVEDTTTLHRAGATGLLQVKRDGHALERLIAEGSDFAPFLDQLNRQYKKLNLTIGGVADMLGIAFGWLIARSDITPCNITAPEKKLAQIPALL